VSKFVTGGNCESITLAAQNKPRSSFSSSASARFQRDFKVLSPLCVTEYIKHSGGSAEKEEKSIGERLCSMPFESVARCMPLNHLRRGHCSILEPRVCARECTMHIHIMPVPKYSQRLNGALSTPALSKCRRSTPIRNILARGNAPIKQSTLT
jgi:hypothetical protein